MLLVARGERMREDVEPMLLQRFVPEFLSAQPPAEPAREVRTDIPGDLPPVLANHECLDQILENLLTNARKYSTPGAPIEIGAHQQDGRVVLRVADHGRHLTEDEVAHLFEPFYRGESARKRSGGAGLGLAVCRRLAEMLDGSLTARARDGGGLEVSLSVPAATTE
jgi:signal transduction histidine kinase